MFPEDRVLVGVINRKRDLVYARDQHWYRIPQRRMPDGITTEYLAFFLSRAFGDRNGAIHYYAQFRALELHYRRDLLPDELDHPRADEAYYRVAIDDLQPKAPPILNATQRRFAFIFTTWDRFVNAKTIPDLYSQNDFFVDRIYYALQKRGLKTLSRTWEAERRSDTLAPGLRILCENGMSILASAEPNNSAFYMDQSQSEDKILQDILAKIASNGGPATVSIPPGE